MPERLPTVADIWRSLDVTIVEIVKKATQTKKIIQDNG